jgi:hypothetical protein
MIAVTRRKGQPRAIAARDANGMISGSQDAKPGGGLPPRRPGRLVGRRRLLHGSIRVIVVAGLTIDSYVHLNLAATYSETGGVISEGVLFRAEASVALLAAIMVAVRGRRLSYLAALLVAASALATMLVARYVDLGAIGPFPDLYDPVWFPEKALAGIAEGVATLAALAGLILLRSVPGRPRKRSRSRG